MRKVLVVSSSRADFGILSNLLKLIQKDKSLKLQFVITGSHLKKGKFSSLNEIIQNKIKISETLNIQTKNQNLNETVKIYSNSLVKFKKIFNRLKPDLILILGDRFEIYAAALSAFFSRIPIAHIHGGEVTLGALDDSIRHSITKLSNFHFVTNKEHFNRVKQLGENPKNIFLVGSLSSENISTSNYLKKKELQKKINFKFRKQNILVTFHPVTLEQDYGKNAFLNLLKFLRGLKKIGILFTSPNLDVKNNFFLTKIKKFVKINKNSILINSMGRSIYFSILNIIDCMIGNSSSGVLETPKFKLPVINIGNRQTGRFQNKNIINLDSNFRVQNIKKKLYQAT